MKTFIKSLLIGKDKDVYEIKYGVARGIKMVIDPNGGSMRIFGLDETELMPFVKRFALECDLFLDVGSSDGFYPLIYRKYNATGEICSIEADHNRAVDQTSNFSLNKFGVEKLRVIEKYVGDRDDELFVTIDTLVAERNRRVFLKIDIEGGELSALRGAKDLIAANNCKIIIETHSRDLELSCERYLQQSGYKTRILSHAWFRKLIPESRQIEHNRWLVAEK